MQVEERKRGWRACVCAAVSVALALAPLTAAQAQSATAPAVATSTPPASTTPATTGDGAAPTVPLSSLMPKAGNIPDGAVFGRVPPADPPTGPVIPPPLPNSGLPEMGDVSQADLSPAQERKLGDMIMKQARAQGAIMNDPEVTDYLNDIGNRLVAAVPDATSRFYFFAVNDPTINAFALPGGYIGVHTGLILLTQSESELAAVLGHEITHVTQHHLARSLAKQKDTLLMSLAALALAILAAKGGGAQGAQAASAAIASAQALSIQTQLNFTRDNEYEADRIGFQRMVAAGFDPSAMATFMTRMQSANRFADGNAPSYLRSHPVTFERIAEAQARAASQPYRQVKDSLDFQMVRALLRSYQGEPKDAVAYFEHALAEHQYNSETAARYGLVASLLRTKDWPRAKAELATLEKTAPAHPMIQSMAGHVALESGDVERAVTLFRDGAARWPNKMQFAYDYPDSLIKAGRPKEAAAAAEAALIRFPDDGELHRIAAQAYGATGQEQKQHQHQGEYYAWMGNLKGAITQFELASKATDGDFYSSSVVETRLKALRKQADEEDKETLKNAG